MRKKQGKSKIVVRIVSQMLLISSLVMMGSITVLAASFKDVKNNASTPYADIMTVTQGGMMSGTNGYFYPAQAITRADAAKAIAIATKQVHSPTFKPRFKDVPVSDPNYSYIAALTEAGVFNNAERFNPKASLTRSQMAKILTLGFQIESHPYTKYQFNDVPRTADYYPYVASLGELKITILAHGSNFRPAEHVKRAQMASFINRSIQFDHKRSNGQLVYNQQKGHYEQSGQAPHLGNLPSPIEQTVQFVNEQRRLNLVHALHVDKALSYVAQVKAEDMARYQYFDHYSPRYGKPGEMLDRYQYPWLSYGENIAKGYGNSADRVVDAWMNSPGHRSNILQAKFQYIGFGHAVSASGEPYWVHLFAKK